MTDLREIVEIQGDAVTDVTPQEARDLASRMEREGYQMTARALRSLATQLEAAQDGLREITIEEYARYLIAALDKETP